VERKTITRIIILLIVITVVSIWIVKNQPPLTFYYSAGWIAIIGILLWWGNKGLTLGLDRLLPWNRWGNFRFFVHLLLGLIYLLALVNLSYIVLKVILNAPPTIEQIIVMNAWGAFLFIPVFAIYFSLHFLRHWRKSELDVEKYHKENIRSQLESLKNHLDPHFLFNNLNILSSLIDKDQKRSKDFIEHFADVYRAILRTKSEDLITLREELEFIQSYIYLIKTRFEENIIFTIDSIASENNYMIPPLTLQMLVENAIKHNVITERNPLQISILRTAENYLIVRNSLRENKQTNAGNGTGLSNIHARYAHFTDQPVKVVKTDKEFEVHIPLLQIESV
jgi:sensor histidine kinase YesM